MSISFSSLVDMVSYKGKIAPETQQLPMLGVVEPPGGKVMGQINWGDMAAQGVGILSSVLGGRRSRGGGGGMAAGLVGPPSPGMLGLAPAAGELMPRRKRRRGITARDLRSFRRVANLIRTYAAPVRHFRTHPKRRGFGR